MKLKNLLKGLAAVSAVALIAGCAGPTDDGPTDDGPTDDGSGTGGSDEPIYGGVLIVAEDGSWPTLDPHTTNTNAGPQNHIFETLLSYHLVDPETGEHELSGLLAESWETPDDTTIEFKLREGVKFHDGSDWNAEVAKWNLDRIRETTEGVGYTNIQSVESVEIIDDYAIRLNLSSPQPSLLIHLSQAAGVGTNMISKEAFEAGGDEIEQFVGTGPFKATEFRLDEQTTLEKNEDYWQKDSEGRPLPYLDGMVFRVLLDKAVVVTELRAGTIHLGRNVAAPDLKILTTDPTVRYVPYMGAEIQPGYLGFNTTTGPFADPNVRLAAMMAIDRGVVASTVGYNATPQEVPYFGTASLGWEDSLNEVWPYDPEEARRLLAEAGTPTVQGTLTFQAREPDQTIGTIIQQMWSDVGIEVELLPTEEAAWVSNMQEGNFDVSMWGASVPPDPALSLAAFSCEGATNWSQYCNEELETVYASGGATFDEQARIDAYHEALGIVAEQAPFGPLFAEQRNHVESAKVMNSGRNWYFYDLTKAWLTE